MVAIPIEPAAVEAQLRAEAARDAMARLLAIAGHDLKQPLQIALMAIERILSEGVVPQVGSRLGLVHDSLRRLGRELDELARFSQVSGARPSLGAVSLAAVLSNVESEWRPHAEISGIRLRLRPTHLHAVTEASMLTTVLRNLIGNAIKYSRPGGRVVVGCRRCGGLVSLEVHDDGEGIAPERLATIFDAFDRGGRRDESGMGLGLHIVRETAQALGHQVGVRSLHGRGSAFSVSMARVTGTATSGDGNWVPRAMHG